MGTFTLPNGVVLADVHDPVRCQGRPCVIHSPTPHCMSHLRLHWRGDRKIFERICIHGVGHPDPDQYQYWREIYAVKAALGEIDSADDWSYETIHGCCAEQCCRSSDGY